MGLLGKLHKTNFPKLKAFLLAESNQLLAERRQRIS